MRYVAAVVMAHWSLLNLERAFASTSAIGFVWHFAVFMCSAVCAFVIATEGAA